MGILGPLQRTTEASQYVIVVTDRDSKLTRTVPTTKTSSTQIANIFLDLWIISSRVSRYVPTNSDPQLMSKFFQTICGYSRVKHVTTTTYHRQTNGQGKRYSKTVLTRLRHYIAVPQRDWDVFVYPFTYGYSTEVYQSTNKSPYIAELCRPP